MRILITTLFSTAVFTLVGGTAAAQTEPRDQELAQLRQELVAIQQVLNETRQALIKSQSDQAATKAKLAEMTRAMNALRTELESEKVHHEKAVAQLTVAIKEATVSNGDVTKTQVEAAPAQKSFAAAPTRSPDDLRKSLEPEVKPPVVRLEALNTEAILNQIDSKTAAAKPLVANAAQSIPELNPAQQSLVLRPLPATIVVTLPSDAQLKFNDSPTSSTGGSREFISPALSPGRAFYYELKAEVMREGQMITIDKRIEIRAGDRIEVSLPMSAAESIGNLP